MINNIIDYLIFSYSINPIGQIIGLLGFIISIISFFNTNDKKVKIINGISLIFWSIHFISIGLFIAAITSIIGTIRNFLSVRFKGSLKMFIFFSFLYLISGIFMFKNIISIIPILSSIIASYAFIMFGGIKLRITLIFASLMWIFYNFIGHSIGGIILETFLIFSHIIMIFYFFIGNRLNLINNPQNKVLNNT